MTKERTCEYCVEWEQRKPTSSFAVCRMLADFMAGLNFEVKKTDGSIYFYTPIYGTCDKWVTIPHTCERCRHWITKSEEDRVGTCEVFRSFFTGIFPSQESETYLSGWEKGARTKAMDGCKKWERERIERG